MSTESKRAYRFDYLKSEEWKTVRLEALAREDAKCQCCGDRSLTNDAHHVWYPKFIRRTRAHHLVILCRPCHDLLHSLFPECKTSDKVKGWTIWQLFHKSINRWRMEKSDTILAARGIKIPDVRHMRARLKELESKQAGSNIAT